MRRSLLAAGLAVFLIVQPVAATAGIGWRHAPIGLDVYANVDSPIVAQAIAQWNVSPYVELVPTGTSAKGTFTFENWTWPCGQKRGAIVICVTSIPRTFAYLPYKGGYLASAFVALTTTMSLSLACHEIGHALGLNHTHADGDPDSCLNQPTGSDHPSVRDYADLAAMYGP